MPAGGKRPEEQTSAEPLWKKCRQSDAPAGTISTSARQATLLFMGRLNSTAYQIGAGSGVCAATGRALIPGEPFVTALVEVEDSEQLARVEFCAEAWESGSRPARMFGFWRGVVAEPNAKPRLLIDDDALLDMFEQLAEAADPRRVAFRFVLALILIRKRVLVCEDARGRIMLVRARGTPRPPEGPPLVEVIDPGMQESEIEGVIEQLDAVMASPVPGPQARPPADTGERA